MSVVSCMMATGMMFRHQGSYYGNDNNKTPWWVKIFCTIFIIAIFFVYVMFIIYLATV
jgi:uncharacterized membrane-anchored protein